LFGEQPEVVSHRVSESSRKWSVIGFGLVDANNFIRPLRPVPGLAHGGVPAAMVDEALDMVVRLLRMPPVTGRLEIDCTLVGSLMCSAGMTSR
jgi:hypothetical protein